MGKCYMKIITNKHCKDKGVADVIQCPAQTNELYFHPLSLQYHKRITSAPLAPMFVFQLKTKVKQL